MIRLRRLLGPGAALALAACAAVGSTQRPIPPAEDGWTSQVVQTRAVSLGLPGGAELAPGVRFAGGLQISAPPGSPIHSLSDLKRVGERGLVSVSDTGDLIRADLRLDGSGRLVGLEALRSLRLTGLDGLPIGDKAAGDAEGLLLTDQGELLVSFERDHRIWSYGPLARLSSRPTAMRKPDAAFDENAGMEGLASAPGGGWRVAGEGGGLWDCDPDACRTVQPPPAAPIPDGEFRITALDRDPAGDGWFVVQRLYRAPIDMRAQVRRMTPDGALGPVLISLKLPGTTDNFEGVSAERLNGRTRLYVLSDDNFNPAQRTLLLGFDVD
ncbi:esterase-like activity of phytase family protein [Brevundimonas sp. PAMC22021]|uniref:esterase-like activity of phytase family protein n=1 Tax=Brevundimonas sp. PAMC22021 TaxID=2861285 RepID=UPI001C635AE9|nr:esterase-like activity of phytase family protein [Brevundimonas sp. PAMC22021]QYF86884.1 esterase-like activity of phytase family protein [Brevundimonas sp. PAMC22021]